MGPWQKIEGLWKSGKKLYKSKLTAVTEPEVLKNAKQYFSLPTPWKKAKNTKLWRSWQTPFFSWQTTSKRPNFWNLALKMPTWQPCWKLCTGSTWESASRWALDRVRNTMVIPGLNDAKNQFTFRCKYSHSKSSVPITIYSAALGILCACYNWWFLEKSKGWVECIGNFFAVGFSSIVLAKTRCLNTDVWKLESSQSEKCRACRLIPLKTCCRLRAFRYFSCMLRLKPPYHKSATMTSKRYTLSF